MADAKRRLAAKPTPTVETSVGRVYLSTVPDGRYRVTLPDGDHLALKFRLADKSSKLAGSRIIATRMGEDWQGIAHIAPDGSLRLWRSLIGTLRARVTAAIDVLDDAKTEDAWLVAGLAFAQEGSVCFICGRDLDTPESLTAGYGPICADKHGLPWGEKAIPMSVRLAQATAAEPVPAAPAPSVAPVAYIPRPYVEDAAIVADRARDKEMIARAKSENRPRTYAEIFGED
jgi:hypothetical protein